MGTGLAGREKGSYIGDLEKIRQVEVRAQGQTRLGADNTHFAPHHRSPLWSLAFHVNFLFSSVK